jgi:DNA-binding NarL/FixJ family response regulator
MDKIRILLVEDHALVRAGMRVLLSNIEGIEIVGEAGSGREALSHLEQQKPDIVLMDIAMEDMNGLEATAQIAAQHPQVRVLMLSMHASEEYVLQALQAGAAGYLLKDAGTAELELAIRAVARGETYLSPAISKYVVAGYVQRVGGGQETSQIQLTPRQREILRLIAEGQSTREIAQTLFISIKTVETHRAQLMERLGIRDIAGLVRYAIRMGLVRPDL